MRYQIVTHGSDQECWLRDLEADTVPFKTTGINQVDARVAMIRKVATAALTGELVMTDVERFAWLTHAAELASDDAYADLCDRYKDPDAIPAAFDNARHSIYQAQYAIDAFTDDENCRQGSMSDYYTPDQHPSTYAIKATLADALKEAGFIDTSWRNDICASFSNEVSDQHIVRLWIEAVDPDERESEGARFTVALYTADMEWLSDIFETEDEAEALSRAVLTCQEHTS